MAAPFASSECAHQSTASVPQQAHAQLLPPVNPAAHAPARRAFTDGALDFFVSGLAAALDFVCFASILYAIFPPLFYVSCRPAAVLWAAGLDFLSR